MFCLVNGEEGPMKRPPSSVSSRSRTAVRCSGRPSAKGVPPPAGEQKDHTTVKPRHSPTEAAAFFNDLSDGIHNKENDRTTPPQRRRTLQEADLPDAGLVDSGYLSLQNSHLSNHCDDDTDHAQTTQATPRQKTSPLSRSSLSGHASLVTSTPRVLRSHAPPVTSSTPRVSRTTRSMPSLPIVRFQEAVCTELAKSFQRSQRYDWSLVSRLAEGHLLDRVIGGKMGRNHVDIFSSLLSRNMKVILARILALLGDLDLISCRMVNRTWRKIILEDAAAPKRILTAQQHQVSSSSGSQLGSGLTRELSGSRTVLSCVQPLASVSSSLDSPFNQTRFDSYLEAASQLRQHESLRSCIRCRSPAKQCTEAQRATCTRSSCQFDFCTRCQEAFHCSTPCRAIQAHTPRGTRSSTRSSSTRSNRNLHRL